MTGQRLGPDTLRGLFLFEALDDDQLGWLAEHGRVATAGAGSTLFTEGEPATGFFLLLSGTMSMRRTVRGDVLEVNRTDQRGSYAGATQAYLSHDVPPDYAASVVAITDIEVLELPAGEFGAQLREWFPMATHLLEGLFFGMRSSQELVGQRERLLALGQLSAGLTHELNNPAAAAGRATEALRDRVSAMRHKLAALASGRLDPDVLSRLTDRQEEAVRRVATAPALTSLAASDREGELVDWLKDHSIVQADDLAEAMVQADLDVAFLDAVAAAIPAEHLEGAVRWIGYTVDTELLMNEIADAVRRVSALVADAKQYSQLDRSSHQDVDLHALLDSTLVMLGKDAKGGVTVVKDYDRDLPAVPAYGAELNQVWTNLITNALDAMAGEGTLTIRTGRDGETAVVAIGDTGPGVPTELRQRVFEPFFTTKAVGEGTGLGLDISYRIVVQRHGGDLRLRSAPGDTWFEVRLPLVAAPPSE